MVGIHDANGNMAVVYDVNWGHYYFTLVGYVAVFLLDSLYIHSF
jgi:hypothetical protein